MGLIIVKPKVRLALSAAAVLALLAAMAFVRSPDVGAGRREADPRAEASPAASETGGAAAPAGGAPSRALRYLLR